MAMDPDNVDVNPGSGRAVFQANKLHIQDYHDFVNSTNPGASTVPGIVSFRVDWAPSHDKHHYRHAPHQWEGHFVQTSATCSWSGRTAVAEFSTDTNDPTMHSIFAEVGHERSGLFFSDNSDQEQGPGG